jgi:5-methylcytosine-specific restriction endonuclease McrA
MDHLVPEEEKHLKRSRRKAARERHLNTILRRDGYKCHWCQRPLVRKSGFNYSILIHNGGHWGNYRDDTGKIVKIWWATTDHLVDLLNKDANRLENLVPSCGPCNNARHSPTQRTPPLWLNNPVCKCGLPKRPYDKRCSTCTDVMMEVHAAVKGTGYKIIRRQAGHCPDCRIGLVPFIDIPTVGVFYRCPLCVKQNTSPTQSSVRVGRDDGTPPSQTQPVSQV